MFAGVEFLGLGVAAWITIVTVLTIFILLLKTNLPADILFLGCMGVFLVTGVLSPKDVLSGFSSTSVVVVGVLFAVIAGLMNTGVLHWIVKHIMGVPKSFSMAVMRVMLPVALLSSFLSNTTVVALFLDVVKMWSKKLKIAPSKLLIPLTYASCFGGVCTLLGTPPNLLISGFYMQDTGVELSIFTTTLPGLFCLAVGFISILAMRRLLPERKSPDSAFEKSSDYTVEFLVPTECGCVGKSVEEAGLNKIDGGRLIEIVRFDKEVISPVADDEFIFGGDRLVFAGEIQSLLELKDKYGFVNATHHVFSVKEVGKNRNLYTAYVAAQGGLIGKTIERSGIEQANDVVLVAVAREGERIDKSPRDIVLKAGDVLLLEGKSLKKDNFEGVLHFFDSDEIPKIGKKTLLSSGIMVAMVLLSAFNIMPLLNSCFLAAGAMLITRCCTPAQVQKSINWSVLMIFAGSVCMGNAIEQTGIAQIVADGLMSVCGSNPIVVLIAICTVGVIITEFVSNTAAAAVFYPIAYNSAVAMGVNPLTFCVGLMIAVSCGFAMPIGSPTHMLVYGPGGYKFTDFIKIGVPMNLIILAANIVIVLLLFPL